jgi:hypothetical protein
MFHGLASLASPKCHPKERQASSNSGRRGNRLLRSPVQDGGDQAPVDQAGGKTPPF